MSIPVFPEAKLALKGKKALIVDIANEHSIAWGCARASLKEASWPTLSSTSTCRPDGKRGGSQRYGRVLTLSGHRKARRRNVPKPKT